MFVCLRVETTIFQRFGEAMETSCNRDSLGSVGLDLQEFDGDGELALTWTGIRRRKRRIGTVLQEFDGGGEQSLTWTCRSSTEVANSH